MEQNKQELKNNQITYKIGDFDFEINQTEVSEKVWKKLNEWYEKEVDIEGHLNDLNLYDNSNEVKDDLIDVIKCYY